MKASKLKRSYVIEDASRFISDDRSNRISVGFYGSGVYRIGDFECFSKSYALVCPVAMIEIIRHRFMPGDVVDLEMAAKAEFNYDSGWAVRYSSAKQRLRYAPPFFDEASDLSDLCYVITEDYRRNSYLFVMTNGEADAAIALLNEKTNNLIRPVYWSKRCQAYASDNLIRGSELYFAQGPYRGHRTPLMAFTLRDDAYDDADRGPSCVAILYGATCPSASDAGTLKDYVDDATYASIMLGMEI